jgi:hypothetical protein
MTRNTGEIVIDAPADVVFDFVADQRNEPACNPHLVRSAKVTPGPAGKGTQFRSAVRSRGRLAEMAIEYTGFQRPSRLASTTRMAQAEFSGTLTFEPASAGTRLRWSWDARFTLAAAAAGTGPRPGGRTAGTSDVGRAQAVPGVLPARGGPRRRGAARPRTRRGYGRERQPAARPGPGGRGAAGRERGRGGARPTCAAAAPPAAPAPAPHRGAGVRQRRGGTAGLLAAVAGRGPGGCGSRRATFAVHAGSRGHLPQPGSRQRGAGRPVEFAAWDGWTARRDR